MLGMLIAYDAAGDVVATLDYCVQYDEWGEPIGLVDFGSMGELTDVWTVDNAAGSKLWPEWIGSRAHDFRVELVGPPGGKHIAALIHKGSGHRRERADVDALIASAIATADGRPADIRAIVGGPDRPLILDDDGKRVRNG